MSLWTIPLFLALTHKHHLGMSQGRIFTFLPLNGIGTSSEGAKCGAGDWDHEEKDTDEARLSAVKMTCTWNTALSAFRYLRT